jgi:hypothetical protein
MLSIANRRRTRGVALVNRHVVGNALVVHPDERMSDEAKALALAVAEDTEHDIVVLDLPEDLPIGAWESVAQALPRRRRGIRLVVCGRRPETAMLAGQWLSDRLSRPVLAPHGSLALGAAGALFVHDAPDSGWVRHAPRQAPVWESKRHPRPAWDDAVTAGWAISSTAVADPLPGGVWIHPSGYPEMSDERWRQLAGIVPCAPETFPVLVGCPGTPSVALDDVVRFWRSLDPESRERARFVQLGPVDLPTGVPLGQVLADLVGTLVLCLSGVPVGAPDDLTLRTVEPDGRFGWRPFVHELGYLPHAGQRAPTVFSHRPPLDLGEQLEPRTYWFAHDAVIEVIQAGLWMRAPQPPPGAEAVRARAADPRRHLLVYDAETEQRAVRMRALATDVVARLDPVNRDRCTVVAASALTATVQVTVAQPDGHRVADGLVEPAAPARPMPQSPLSGPAVSQTAVVVGAAGAIPPAVQSVLMTAEPESSGLPSPEAEMAQPARPATIPTAATSPTAPPPPARMQPVPAPAASALLLRGTPDKERAWLRRALNREFTGAASVVSRILSEHPGLLGAGPPSEDVLTDAVAVRLYLAAQGDTVDNGLRSAAPGPHVPFARCVVAGLSRLPSHRGATLVEASPTEEQWRIYQSRRLVTEWGFVNALTAPTAGQDGDVDVLIWAMTARRTRLLEPDGDDHVDNRVLFVPGTSFKILDMVRPASAAERGQILLRELAADEIDADGRVDDNRTSFDELAVASLRRGAERWAGITPAGRIGVRSAARFGVLPGMG